MDRNAVVSHQMRYDSSDMRRIGFLLCVLLLTGPACLAIDVVVQVRDTRGKPVSDAVVWITPNDRVSTPARKATAVMDQKNRAFIPHVLPVQVGTSVMFPNSDNVRHQVYSFSPPKAFQLPLYIGTPSNPVVFDKAGVVALGCNIHDQMSAFIIVVDTPHFGKSGRDGLVRMSGLESGEHKVNMWHPEMDHAFTPIELSLSAGENREMTVVVRKK